MMSFFQELKRRNVVRMAIAYLVLAWVLLQAADFGLEVIDAPGWILQVFVLMAAIGMPLVLIFSWVFEITPEGIKRESEIDRSQSISAQTGRKMDRLIISVLAIAVVILLVDRFTGSTAEPETDLMANSSDSSSTMVESNEEAEDSVADLVNSSERSIAVLPFAVMSTGLDDEYFADGLTEEILNSLAQLPELLVTARTSAFSFKGKDLPIQEIASQLGVNNVVEGSVRRSGDRLRVTAQLIRASDGFHIWSENYDSTAEDTIAVQEDIAHKIAGAMNVVLDDEKLKAMRNAGLRDVEAFIALQKGRRLYEEAHGAEDQLVKLREANLYFEQVMQRVPDYAWAYQLHSDQYIHLLMNEATGLPLEGALSEELESAMERAEADTAAGVEKALNDDARNNAALDLAYITSNWQGMSSRIESYLGQTGCEGITWIDNIATVTGYASRLVARDEIYINCDPLSTSNWRILVRNMLWAGNAAGALEVGRQGHQRAPGSWLSLQMVLAAAAMADFETAEQIVQQHFHLEFDVAIGRMLIAAAKGDRETSDQLFADYKTQPDRSLYWDVVFGAWVGDMQTANAAAAAVDQHDFGSPSLLTLALWCACGAPWDLDYTPKFAEDIAESGLQWPPASPVKFPLKDQVAAVRVTAEGS
jgi:TolB-like protein